MSGDQGSKTEQPTPRKLKEARKKGQVSRSEELVPLMMIILAIIYFWAAWGWLTGELTDYLSAVPSYIYDQSFNHAVSTSMNIWFKKVILGIMLPFTGLMLIAGIMGNIMQFGFLFSVDPIIPKPEKINPIAGFKRIFSVKQVVKTLLSILKIVAMTVIIVFVVRTAIYEYMHDIAMCNIPCKFDVFTSMAKKMVLILIPILIMMVMLDIIFQKVQFIKKQKMTKDEVKREFKNQEGDPLIKGQRVSEQRRMLEENISDQVLQSRVIVVGMRKSAGLMFEEGMPLPILLVIGRDRLSYKMIEIAKKEGVPIVADPQLVKILEEDGIIDQYIPSSAIDRVAKAMRGT